jgi:SAM-dependent methyltransferase
MDHIGPSLKGDVLEVGSGPGYLWTENTNRLPADIHMFLSDRSAGMLADARQRIRRAGISADWVECDVLQLPFQHESFDLAIANHMLFLVNDPTTAVAELARVLRPGALLFATTNHRDHLLELFELFIELSPEHFRNMDQGEFNLRRTRFNFVSGAGLLVPHFDDVKLVTYEDGLRIDRVDILIPWINYWARPEMGAQSLEKMLAALSERIGQEGPLRIRKNSGMFLARKAG